MRARVRGGLGALQTHQSGKCVAFQLPSSHLAASLGRHGREIYLRERTGGSFSRA